MGNAAYAALTTEHQMGNYARYPVAFVRGDGARLWDADGKEYLDFLGGIAVALLGHAHPAVTKAIAEQAAKLVHVSNLFHTESQAFLGKELSDACGGGKVFFCNSGAEANEAAIKLARKSFADAGRPEAFEFVVLEGSFHGRTYGGLSATGQPKFHEGFGPMLAGFRPVPFGDIDALAAAVTDSTCAVLLEPMQGEIGVRPHPEGFLKAVENLCREKGILLIADEIQTGMGRTGAFLASTLFGITPDIVTLAKGIANGLPLGAVIAKAEVAKAFTPGSHGSTFGGNPVCCAAARVVVGTLTSPGFLESVTRKGAYLAERLLDLCGRRTDLVGVRGAGLMLGLETTIETKPVAAACLANGLVVNGTNGNIIRFLPPLNVTEADIDRAVTLLSASLPAEGRK